MKHNEFKTKDEYLQYRKEWKAEYKQLTKDIRLLKVGKKDAQRGSTCWRNKNALDEALMLTSKIVEETYRWEPKERAKKLLEGKEYSWILWYSLPTCQQNATRMLEELKLAKQEAQRQYEEQKQKMTTL